MRGSSALTAAVDISISFKRDPYGPDTRRILDAISRDSATPRRLVVDYADDTYVALGTMDEVREGEHTEQLLEAVTTTPQTYDELRDSSEVPLASVKRLAKKLYDTGKLQREGEGKKGAPFRYYRNEEDN